MLKPGRSPEKAKAVIRLCSSGGAHRDQIAWILNTIVFTRYTIESGTWGR